MFLQRFHAFVDEVRDIDGMGRVRRAADADHLDSVPGFQAFIKQFGKYPAIASVAGGVYHREADLTMVCLIKCPVPSCQPEKACD